MVKHTGRILVLLVLLTVTTKVFACTKSNEIPIGHNNNGLTECVSFDTIANAIYHIEGGKNAKKPFGILSVPCSSYSECKRICINTIRNNWYRWNKTERKIAYLEFLAKRYAPIGAKNDPTNLNKYWLKNLQRQITKF